MTDPGAPRRGRHASPEELRPLSSGSRYPATSPNGSSRPDPRGRQLPSWRTGPEADPASLGGRGGSSASSAVHHPSGRSGRLDPGSDTVGMSGPGPRTGSDADGTPRTSAILSTGGTPPAVTDEPGGPQPAGAPLPPRPAGAWSRLRPRGSRPEDDDTQVTPQTVDGSSADRSSPEAHVLDRSDRTAGIEAVGGEWGQRRPDHPARHDGRAEPPPARGPDDHPTAAYAWREHDDRFSGGHAYEDGSTGDRFDETGSYDGDEPAGLFDTDLGRRAADDDYADGHGVDGDYAHGDYADDDYADGYSGSSLPFADIPLDPSDHRRSRGRRRRRRVATLISVLLLAGLALGVVFGGRQLLDLVHSPDYPGQGSGDVRIRVKDGDSLKAIGQTLVDDGVIASVRPFVTAAEAEPRATSIVPGVYGLHRHMSGQAALQLLLEPSSRLVSRVTVPEGLTVQETLQRLAEETGTPLEQLKAAAADPATLQLPAYADGHLEGFLFPATYDFEPGTTPVAMLHAMVARTEQTLDSLQIPVDRRLAVLTEASLVQAEAGSAADMPKVARVLDNRLERGMPLQLDTTVNYANGKSGLTTTPQDRANPSPYNTYAHSGLPPGPITNPGEEALRAVLSPAQGDWLYFVVVDPDTGETRFAATGEEHQKNVVLFQQWLKAHPNG